MTDHAGRTCLHVAASSGHYDMVQVLIGQGADLNVADKVAEKLNPKFLKNVVQDLST